MMKRVKVTFYDMASANYYARFFPNLKNARSFITLSKQTYPTRSDYKIKILKY